MQLSEVIPSQGLIGQGMGQAMPPPPQGGMAPGQTQPGADMQPGADAEQDATGQEQATPEEQQVYERMVMAGLKVLNEATDQIMEMLASGKDNPPKVLADTLWTIMASLDEKSGGKTDPAILLHAGAEVMENLAEYANKAGVMKVTEKIQGRAWQLVMQRFEQEFNVDFAEEFGTDIQGMDPNQLQQIVEQQSSFIEQ